MMEGSRLVWAPPGSFQGPGVSTVPVASFCHGASKENDCFVFCSTEWLCFEESRGELTDDLSCPPGFRWLAHVVYFLRPERGTGVGAGGGRVSERMQPGVECC